MVAVSGVSALYRDGRDNVLALHEFKSRFDARFRELIFDVEEEVAVQAVRGGGVRGGSGGTKPRRSGNVCNGPLQRTTGYFLQMDGAGADEIWVIILYLSLWSFNS